MGRPAFLLRRFTAITVILTLFQMIATWGTMPCSRQTHRFMGTAMHMMHTMPPVHHAAHSETQTHHESHTPTSCPDKSMPCSCHIVGACTPTLLAANIALITADIPASPVVIHSSEDVLHSHILTPEPPPPKA